MAAPRFSELLKEKGESTQEKVVVSTPVSDNISSLVENLEKGSPDGRLNVRLVPRNKIRFHKSNDYPMIKIESLADSILNLDIMNIPSGYYDEEADVYVMENGERRTRALDLLIETYRNCDNKDSAEYELYQKHIAKYEKGYPFHVMLKQEIDVEITRLDEIDSELRLIDANGEVRGDNEECYRAHMMKKIDLLKEKNELLGTSDKQINIAQEICESEEISKRQAYKYTAANSLVPELKALFLDDKITLNDSDFYSKLTPDEQLKIVDLIQSGNKGNALELHGLQQELSKAQNEKSQVIKEFEEKLHQLEEEKKTAQTSYELMKKTTQDNIETAIQGLRAELEAEYQSLNEKNTEEQEKKIQGLKAELEGIISVREKLQSDFEKEQKQKEEKENEIQRLREQIKELREKPDTLVEDPEAILLKVKKEMTYKMSYESLSKGIKDYKAIALEQPIEKTDIIKNLESLIAVLSGIKKTLDK